MKMFPENTAAQKWYASGVLKEADHSRLVADIENIALAAGIAPAFIAEPLAKHCGKGEEEWLTQYLRGNPQMRYGMVYCGHKEKLIARMMAICGCLLRNHVNARVVMLRDLIAELKTGESPDETCLLVPNFHRSADGGGGLFENELATLMGFTMDRIIRARPLIVSIKSMELLRAEYGTEFHELLSNLLLFK
jgi:hypothetical protein